ncbi:hypothetical protein IHQ56_02575 [Methylobacillus flagellatus]|uniref:hypothetical protein n=1 Tax=Methylobacillus flagellatus TaxID=405 RepID=UPI0028539A37|nr:hypothetical protein [Methylobacillus flagellatus]MDR5170694.1 hypothetical protein [Methylobacillus flagellatus]
MAAANSTHNSLIDVDTDTLSFRLQQALGMVNCLRVTTTATDGVIDPCPKTISDALWGISSLLGQAIDALEKGH